MSMRDHSVVAVDNSEAVELVRLGQSESWAVQNLGEDAIALGYSDDITFEDAGIVLAAGEGFIFERPDQWFLYAISEGSSEVRLMRVR